MTDYSPLTQHIPTFSNQHAGTYLFCGTRPDGKLNQTEYKTFVCLSHVTFPKFHGPPDDVGWLTNPLLVNRHTHITLRSNVFQNGGTVTTFPRG